MQIAQNEAPASCLHCNWPGEMRNPASPPRGFVFLTARLTPASDSTILLQVLEKIMGRELVCNIRTGGKTTSAKALLETNEIIIRGELRLRIALASLKSVTVRDGELHLKWPEGSAVLELGEHAEKWAYKILHPKSTAEKLGIKPGLIISAIAIHDGNFVDDLRAATQKFSDAMPLKDSDLIFVGAETVAHMPRIARLAGSLAKAGALWIVYPKGKQEIKEQHVLDAGRRAGLLDVKVVSFSATHTALKFVRPKPKR